MNRLRITELLISIVAHNGITCFSSYISQNSSINIFFKASYLFRNLFLRSLRNILFLAGNDVTLSQADTRLGKGSEQTCRDKVSVANWALEPQGFNLQHKGYHERHVCELTTEPPFLSERLLLSLRINGESLWTWGIRRESEEARSVINSLQIERYFMELPLGI